MIPERREKPYQKRKCHLEPNNSLQKIQIKLLTFSSKPEIASCCCGHLLASTISLASLSILSLALCSLISFSFLFSSLRKRTCIALYILAIALATPCCSAKGLLFVDSTDATIQSLVHGGRQTGRGDSSTLSAF